VETTKFEPQLKFKPRLKFFRFGHRGKNVSDPGSYKCLGSAMDPGFKNTGLEIFNVLKIKII